MRRKPRVRLNALTTGGGQERGMRSGTLPTPLCVGLGEACAIAQTEMINENTRLKTLHAQLYNGLTANLSEIYVNGDMVHRVPGNLNISFAYVEGEGLMMGIKDLEQSQAAQLALRLH